VAPVLEVDGATAGRVTSDDVPGLERWFGDFGAPHAVGTLPRRRLPPVRPASANRLPRRLVARAASGARRARRSPSSFRRARAGGRWAPSRSSTRCAGARGAGRRAEVLEGACKRLLLRRARLRGEAGRLAAGLRRAARPGARGRFLDALLARRRRLRARAHRRRRVAEAGGAGSRRSAPPFWTASGAGAPGPAGAIDPGDSTTPLLHGGYAALAQASTARPGRSSTGEA